MRGESSRSAGRAGAAAVLVLAALVPACVRARYFPGGGLVQTGMASWYGPDFHGRATASREVYDMHDMTAAHRTLPFGARVMVTNLGNGRSAVVRINDRGPFARGRIIDLSYAAASLLDMIGTGTAPVRVEVLPGESPPPSSGAFSVQAGSFLSRENADRLARGLRGEFPGADVSAFKTGLETYFRVRIPARDRAEAERIAGRLAAAGHKCLILEEG